MKPLHNLAGPVVCPVAVPPGVFFQAGRFAFGKSRNRHGILALLCLAVFFLAGTVHAQTTTPLLNLTNTLWRYNDAGTNLGTSWSAASYPSENTWASGRGLFGLEGSVPYPYPVPIRTPLVLGGGRTTHYFRAHFNHSGSGAGLNVRFNAYVDDGAVFYLNGAEIRRVRLPSGTITFTNKAQLAFPEGVAVTFLIPASSLLPGDNVLAVEVHQNSDTTSDVVFGLEADLISGVPPVIIDPSEPADRAVPQEDATTLTVSASGFPSPAYQWFKNGGAVSGAVGDSLPIFNMSAGDAGAYYCVVSNLAGVATSRVASVVFLRDTNGPVILYALGQQNLTDILVVFTEPPSQAEAEDVFRWRIVEAGSGTGPNLIGGRLENGTNLTLTTDFPRDPSQRYLLLLDFDLNEAVDHGNPLPGGTETRIASFEAPLVSIDESTLWRYYPSGAHPGTGWTSAAFDDSGWPTGAGLFEVLPGQELLMCRPGLTTTEHPIRTCIPIPGVTNANQTRTTYFRIKFNFDGDIAHRLLRLQTVMNDGAVFYLNGVELVRAWMPVGPISHHSQATRTIGTAFPEYFDQYAPGLVAGENILAVELHQGPLQSGNFTFGLNLIAMQPVMPVARPRLTIQINGTDAGINWTPATGVLEATDDLSAAWMPVGSGAPGQFVVPVSGLQKYYRVVVQP